MIQAHSYDPIPENMAKVFVFISRNTGVNKTHLLMCPKVFARMYIYLTTIISMKQCFFTLQKMDFFSRTKIP